MKTRIRLVACVSALGCALAGSAAGGQESLRVATKEVPPFAMRMPDGSWTGISIQLWKQFALEADLEYQLIEMELHELLDALEQGNVDAGVAALTIAADREELFDFSHPFVISGLALAVRPNEGSAWGAALDRLLDEGFVRGFALGLLALAITSVVVWRLEARKNPEQFGGVVSGIGSALWWSVVTMTTVGYGDKAPATVPGRLLAVVWMIAGLILISALTATITSALTVSQLSSIQGLEDLADEAVATVEESTGEDYLRRHGARTLTFTSLDECVAALTSGRVAAVVYDKPLLGHFALSHPDIPLHLVAGTLVSWGYGIGLPSESSLREPLNRFLLRHVNTPEWDRVVARHVGR